MHVKKRNAYRDLVDRPRGWGEGEGEGGNDLLKGLRRNRMGETGFCNERSGSVRCGAFTQ